MTDSSEIGRYGTLRLLKRHEPDTTVAFFPIDDEEVTFGRSKQCSVRLYYDCVSELHCTLHISEEHKAFLLVQGTNGLLIDGCQVNPSTSGSSPTTVPLTNGSEIEIYKKRFRFEYPPKEIRAALLATPRHGTRRRSLRMSMITSAQVLTPRLTSNNMSRKPRRGSIKDNADWEALRSPVKMPGCDATPREMLLLEGQGDDAVVVEEEKDLIILEQVEDQIKNQQMIAGNLSQPSKPEHSVAFSIPKAIHSPKPVPVPQSVHRVPGSPLMPSMIRRRSGLSLHRAVVLRSAQRAQRERERHEEQQEVDEVEAEVSPERDLGPLEVSKDGEHDEEDEEHGQPVSPSKGDRTWSGRRSSVFQASLDVVKQALPFPFTWKGTEELPSPTEEEREEEEEDDNDDDDDLEEQYEQDNDPDFSTAQTQTPVRRNLGPFMTPQIMVNRPAQRIPVDVKARASIGGEGISRTFGGARRVRTISPWKIQDIILPEPEKPRIEDKYVAKSRVTEDERQAILARRKSALHSPVLLPMPGPRGGGFAPASDEYTPGENEDEDVETMVENMKRKMAQVRRKSEARKVRLSASPQKIRDFSLLAAGASRANRGFLEADLMEETLSQTKRAELDEENIVADSASLSTGHGNRTQDTFSLPDDSRNGEINEHTPRANSKTNTSLTPRFDGVREMFRQPRWQPTTPSFAGFKKMFQDPDVPRETPSFRGVKEMFRQPDPKSVLATPQLNLGDVFDNKEENDNDDFGNRSKVEHVNVDSEGASDDSLMLLDNHSSEEVVEAKADDDDDDQAATLSPTQRVSRHSRISASEEEAPSKKEHLCTVSEDSVDEADVHQDSEPKKPTTARRTTKRSAKTTVTPMADDTSDSGNHPRHTRKEATTSSKTTARSKSRRVRKEATEESDEEQAKSEQAVSGRSKRVTRQQVSEDTNGRDVEARGATTRKIRDMSSDGEGATIPKARRGRAAKIPQAAAVEAPVATNTKMTRRGKAEHSPDSEGLAPVTKAKTKRGAKTKVVEAVEENVSAEEVAQSSELEEVAPVSNKGRRGRAKTPVSQDGPNDDKENTGEHPNQPTGKKPGTRARRAPVITEEALDAPAKRTRSKK